MLRSDTTMSASLAPSIAIDLKKVRLESKKFWSNISLVMFMHTRLYLGTGSRERRNFWYELEVSLMCRCDKNA